MALRTHVVWLWELAESDPSAAFVSVAARRAIAGESAMKGVLVAILRVSSLPWLSLLG
jgi:hypothetical protein